MTSLYLRNLFFTILQPGIVAGLIPYWMLKNDAAAVRTGLLQQITGGLIGCCGLMIMLTCILRFATEGKGTLSPADPTKKLVIKGLYRYSRNPMYIGVLGILTGEAVFFGSYWLWIYAAGIFALFFLFVVGVEEPRLKRDFGEDYSAYCKRVRRWV